MYEIRKDGALLALTEQVNYIRLHPDGFYLLCPEAEAQGVAVAGTPYHLMGRDEMPECETVLVQETDAGAALQEATARAEADVKLSGQMQAAVPGGAGGDAPGPPEAGQRGDAGHLPAHRRDTRGDGGRPHPLRVRDGHGTGEVLQLQRQAVPVQPDHGPPAYGRRILQDCGSGRR